MVRHRRPPSHGWRTFLLNHVDGIASIRRECLDHVIVFGEQHLRRVLRSYQQYYNGTRTHLSLAKDAPLPRAIQTVGSILPLPVLGGLHHHYARI